MKKQYKKPATLALSMGVAQMIAASTSYGVTATSGGSTGLTGANGSTVNLTGAAGHLTGGSFNDAW